MWCAHKQNIIPFVILVSLVKYFDCRRTKGLKAEYVYVCWIYLLYENRDISASACCMISILKLICLWRDSASVQDKFILYKADLLNDSNEFQNKIFVHSTFAY